MNSKGIHILAIKDATIIIAVVAADAFLAILLSHSLATISAAVLLLLLQHQPNDSPQDLHGEQAGSCFLCKLFLQRHAHV